MRNSVALAFQFQARKDQQRNRISETVIQEKKNKTRKWIAALKTRRELTQKPYLKGIGGN